MTFQPTDEQLAVIDLAKGHQSLMIQAYAGTAKTTTLTLAAPGVKGGTLVLAFNKKIAQELQGRLPGSFLVKTLNGLGYGALRRGLPSVINWKIDDRKLGKIISAEAKDRKIDLSSEQWDQVRQLVVAAQNAGVVPMDIGAGGLVPDTPELWQELASDCWIAPGDTSMLVELAWNSLRQSNEMARSGIISFDDQIYASICLGGRFALFENLMVDEAQDLSPMNHAMLRKSLRASGRLLSVGDSRQAIYGFRGAHTDSMGQIRGLRPEPDWQDLGLTMTFRCPKVVVARQEAHAPGFRAFPANPEGRFIRVGNPMQPWTWRDIECLRPRPEASLAVLCRNNAPLLKLAFRLIRQQVGVYMLGTDIGKGLKELSRKLAKDDFCPADQVWAKVEEWRGRETSLALANGQDEKAARVADRADCLLAVLESAGPRDAGELRRCLDVLFDRSSGTVVLSSIHRAKGLEWDTVVLLDPWRIPSKHAKQAAAEGDSRQLQQEYNLRYVAETRTRLVLAHASLADMETLDAND